MSARGWVLVCGALVVLAPGCHYTFDAEGAHCGPGGDCPPGFSCGEDLLCHAARDGGGGGGAGDGGAADGGTGDAGTDAGQSDAGPADSGQGDAGQDDAGAPDAGTDGGSGLCDCARTECDGQPCRLATGLCDLAELCANAACPVDAKTLAGTLCGPGSCTGTTREVPRSCDGLGACRAGTPEECSPFGCGNGLCLLSCQLSSECAPGNYCNSFQACVAQLDNGLSCTLDESCLSNHCVDGVCCNVVCGGACDACNLAGFVGECSAVSRGSAGSPACAHYRCDGSGLACASSCSTADDCVAADYCNSASACVVKKANGIACNSATQCASDFCVDGVCCDSSCGAGCDSCNRPGAVGTCTVADAGTPGSNPACAPYLCAGNAACPSACTMSSQCANDAGCVGLVCDGKLGNGQACAGPSECVSNSCADGVCCDDACVGACNRCDLVATNGTCTPNTGAADAGCGSYVCGLTSSCPSSCTSETDCAPGHYCNGTGCLPRLANGSSCGSDGQCSSGTCAEGVCCSSACSGSCQTCLQSRGASANGTCGNVTAATDPKNGCSPYRCNGSGNCATGCTGTCQSQCASGFQCSNDNCVGLVVAGGSCMQNCECANNTCSSFFHDADSDGYGDPNPTEKRSFCGTTPPLGYLTTGTDCCDSNDQMHPGQFNFFGSAACGSFDYDCSGLEEKEFPDTGGSCQSTYPCCTTMDCEGCTNNPTHSTMPGWYGMPAACGVMGALYVTGTCASVPLLNEGVCGAGGYQGNCNLGTEPKNQRCR